MKSLTSIVCIILLAIACKKDPIQKAALLTQITVDGKTEQSFEYNQNNLLVKELDYGMCTTTPQDEYSYTYQDNRPVKAQSTIRGIYSSLTAMCDPTKGLQTEDTFIYDGGRISKVVHGTVTITYVYNSKGLTEKKTITQGSTSLTYLYEYDARGNVIKETDPQGAVSTYEYDTKTNPLYQIKSRLAILTPFNMSPNNLIKGRGLSNFERKFTYTASGWPASVLEDNGRTYHYIYK